MPIEDGEVKKWWDERKRQMGAKDEDGEVKERGQAVGYDPDWEEKKSRMEWGEMNARMVLEGELDYWKRTRGEQGFLPSGGPVSDRLAESTGGRLRIRFEKMTEDVIREVLIMCKEGTVNLILEDRGIHE